jgi:urease accessory protein
MVSRGAEMPQDASGLFYGMGFMTATALLHAAGIAACFAAAKQAAGRGFAIAKIGGGVAALAGVGVVSGAL